MYGAGPTKDNMLWEMWVLVSQKMRIKSDNTKYQELLHSVNKPAIYTCKRCSQNILSNLPFFKENITEEFRPDESSDPPIVELGGNDINTDYEIFKKGDYILYILMQIVCYQKSSRLKA